MEEVAKIIYQVGGTVVMAVLFVWVFVKDKNTNDEIIKNNNEMLKILSENSVVQNNSMATLTESNNNISKALDIISNNMITIDHKVDRNYEEIIKKEVTK